jgi:O-antigen/teichoic acid export membrane protein
MTQDRSGEQVGRLAKQSALLLSSGVVSYTGAFALSIVLARALGASGFGAWAVGFGLAKTFSTLGLMGADWIILRQGSYYEGIGDTPRLRATLRMSLRLSGVVLMVFGAAFGLGSALIARSVFHDPDFASLLALVGVMIPISGLGQLMLFGTQAFKQQKDYALIRNIVQPLLRLACVAAALLIVRSELSAFAGLVAAESLLLMLSLVALNRRVSLRGPTEPIERRKLTRFAMPVWGTKIVDTTRGQLFPILLGSVTSFSASGAYVASQRIAVAPTAIIAAMNQVYKPIGSDLFLQGRHNELGTLFKSIGKWSFAMGFPLFCLQVVFRDDILALFGETFENAGPALMLLAIGMLFSFGTGPVATTLLMSGRGTIALVDHVLVIATEVVLALVLIPPFGLLGAATARMMGNVVNNGLRLLQVWRILGLHPYSVDYWKPIVAGGASTALAWGVVGVAGLSDGLQSAVGAGVVVAAAYVGCLTLFGLSDEDKNALSAIRKVKRRARASKSTTDVETPDLI